MSKHVKRDAEQDEDEAEEAEPKPPVRDKRVPIPTAPATERAILAAVLEKRSGEGDPRDKKDDPLEELASLAKTAGIQVLPERVVQRRERPDVATYLGKGAVVRLGEVLAEQGANVVIFDNDLSPGQRRNLDKVIKAKVVDRTELILDIFAQHARTIQARLQVELAQLEYSLPRLRGLWSHLDTGVGRRAAGEKQIEVDKRLLRIRIQEIRRELDTIRARKERQVQRRELFTVAIVGYTNAGKSTLMNRLTQAGVYVADKLFATLDTRTKPWRVGPNRVVLLSDTVGFIRQLPHHLVESFHATLEEVITADLLLHVVDASDPDALDQVAAVRDVLESLGAKDKPEVVLLNKIDRVEQPELLPYLERRFARSVRISALTGEGIEPLKALVNDLASAREARWSIELDVREGAAIAYLEGQAEALRKELIDERLRFEVRCGDWVIAAVKSKTRDREGLVIEQLEAPRERPPARPKAEEDDMPLPPWVRAEQSDVVEDLLSSDSTPGADEEDDRPASARGITSPRRGSHRPAKKKRK